MISNARELLQRTIPGAFFVALISMAIPVLSQKASVDTAADQQTTATPVKHVIVLIGENRTFDHLFATYVPKNGEKVSNLLSKGIINADGTPGAHFERAQQYQ